MPTEILLVSIARAVVEVAGLFLLGQGILWIFGPKARDGNFIYDLFKKGTRPSSCFTRVITPRFVHDAHIGLVAFFLLVVWLGLAVAKRHMCVGRVCNARNNTPGSALLSLMRIGSVHGSRRLFTAKPSSPRCNLAFRSTRYIAVAGASRCSPRPRCPSQ